jgi:hypothetical protein
MPLSIFFSFHPFANIRSAIFKINAIRFATHQKAHYGAIYQPYLFQVQNDVVVVRLEFKNPPQLGYRLSFDSADQDEYRESPSRRSLDPKSHRSGPFDQHRSRGFASLLSFDPGTDHQ